LIDFESTSPPIAGEFGTHCTSVSCRCRRSIVIRWACVQQRCRACGRTTPRVGAFNLPTDQPTGQPTSDQPCQPSMYCSRTNVQYYWVRCGSARLPRPVSVVTHSVGNRLGVVVVECVRVNKQMLEHTDFIVRRARCRAEW